MQASPKAWAPVERGSANGATGDAGFYARLEPFGDFAGVGDPARYIEAPSDWLLVMADIKDSTEAARAGRYKDVNMVGAACITATLNATAGLELPYSFGGDGATVLIPPEVRDVVADALIRTRHLAKAAFGLELRVGMVPVQELRGRGARVLVAKFELSPGNHLAMLAGGGVELAERLIKGGAGFELEHRGESGPPDLHGLSCRWQPYRSLRGHMLTLLVRSLEADRLRLHQEIIEALRRILAEAPETAGPIQRANMRFSWPPTGLRAEAIATRGRRPYWLRRLYLAFESFLLLLADRFDVRIGPFDPTVYREEMRRNSDYRKVADTLHMVLDCTEAQIAAIEAHLTGLHAQGRIVYGTHRADEAMMTCLVFSLEESRHVHFVDGADGGYALAALQLKTQLQGLAD
jgi:Protein of unknown function (DUF3095)